MTEPKDLLLVIEQLRRSNRQWKTLALAACSAILIALFCFFAVYTAQAWANREVRAANAARARANQDRVDAQRAANPGQPK
jgi:hypothetical protein